MGLDAFVCCSGILHWNTGRHSPNNTIITRQKHVYHGAVVDCGYLQKYESASVSVFRCRDMSQVTTSRLSLIRGPLLCGAYSLKMANMFVIEVVSVQIAKTTFQNKSPGST